jgi:hypothetical protein
MGTRKCTREGSPSSGYRHPLGRGFVAPTVTETEPQWQPGGWGRPHNFVTLLKALLRDRGYTASLSRLRPEKGFFHAFLDPLLDDIL